MSLGSKMAYRRRHQQGVSPSRPSSAFEGFADEGIRNHPPPPSSLSSSVGDAPNDFDSSFPSSPSLAAKAIRASSARRDSSLSSVYGHSNLSNASPNTVPTRPAPPPSKDSRTFEYTSMKNLNESKHGFWDVLARKAKSILDDDNVDQQHEMYERTGSQMPGTTSRGKFSSSNHLEESNSRRDNSKLFKGLGAFTSSLSHIGGTIGNALEEGITIVENRTSGIIHETRKHIKKNPGNSEGQSQDTNTPTSWKQSQLRAQMQTDQELQLKASRDVAMAMAAKAKLLLRELKTVKADLAFAKERCAQLEEENKSLRENRERGGNLEDDDLVRLQLETLLAEKARLANENSIYARENRFLREVVEYHQLTMQDVVYLDESNEEVTEVNPLNLPPEVTRNISSSITGKDAKSSEVTRSISSITGKGT